MYSTAFRSPEMPLEIQRPNSKLQEFCNSMQPLFTSHVDAEENVKGRQDGHLDPGSPEIKATQV